MQLIGQDIRSVVITKYTQKEGLSSYFVTKIIRDSYGFTWVATQEGLNMFDGREFQVFSSYSDLSHRLGASFVYDMVEDKKRNLLWVLTAYGDICGIDLNSRTIKRRITQYANGSKLSLQWLQSLAVADNNLLIGGNNGIKAFDIEKNQFLDLDIQRSIASTSIPFNVSKILTDNAGRSWVFNDGYGITVLNKDLQIIKTFHEGLEKNEMMIQRLRFWDACIDNDTLYVATNRGLKVSPCGDLHTSTLFINRATLLDSTEIFSVCVAGGGKVFCSMLNQLYSWNLNSGSYTIYKDVSSEEDWLALTRHLYYDKDNEQLWVGTQSGLANFSLRRPPFRPFSTAEIRGPLIKHIYSLLPDGRGGMYCGDENGFFDLNMAERRSVQIDATGSATLVFRDWRENVFVGNSKGLQVLAEGKLVPAKNIFPELRYADGDQFNDGFQFNDSLIVMSSILRKGLLVWNIKKHNLTRFDKESLYNKIDDLTIVDFLFKTDKGTLLILTEKSIIEFDPLSGAYKSYFLNDNDAAKPLNNFMDACETRDGYWIATYGGGIVETDKQFRIKKIFSKKEGIEDPAVYRVFAYQGKYIIATTNYGLSLINCKSYHVSNYFEADGLHSDSFEQLCGYQSGDTIYAGGVNGFTVINPALFTNATTAPKLFVKEIRINTESGIIDTCDYGIRTVEIPNNMQQISIFFSALNYLNPSRVTYVYRIRELQKDWINLGNKNYVDMVILPPGEYTLEVRSSNEEGIWNEIPLEIKLHYLPKWYQTGLFKLVIFLVLGGLLYTFFRYRINQIKKQQEIRKGIASDLHDDIGSSLNTIKIFAHLASRDPGNADHFFQIEQSLAQVSQGLRDIIWVLDDSSDTVQELMERIKRFAFPACQAHDIVFVPTVHWENSDKLITKAEKRNLLLIAKESINNSLKYSRCKRIEVTLLQKGNMIEMLIQDDGIGFEAGRQMTGYGLKNIRYRAGQINFILTVNSLLNKGTEIKLVKK